MSVIDEKILPLYQSGLGCRKIAEQINEDPAIVYRRLRRLNLNRSTAQSIIAGRQQIPVPFTSDVARFRRGQEGRFSIGTAITWFLQRGYNASVPVATTTYDLVVESDSGLKRVQIKYSSYENNGAGSIMATIGRRVYNSSASLNSGGKRQLVPYTAAEIDVFFILTSKGDAYLIPIEAVAGKVSVCLDTAYAGYKT